MKYSTGRAFRQALEERLRQQYLDSGIPLSRLRKVIAFERIIARLVYTHPDQWVLKGGLALQLRLGPRARTTKDIDLLYIAERVDLHRRLQQAAQTDLGDWFAYEISQQVQHPEDVFGGMRFPVRALLDGRGFETFHIDIGTDDVITGEVDTLHFSPSLSFADIPSAQIGCYPIPQQIAEKLHAITRPYASGEVSRVKDLIDILLLAGLGPLDAGILYLAFETTFTHRNTHPLPSELPPVPESWEQSFRQLARQVDLTDESLADAISTAQRFINPIIQRQPVRLWNPEDWAWE